MGGGGESVVMTLINFSPNDYSLIMHKLKHKSIYQSIKYKHKTMKEINTMDTYISGGKPSSGKKSFVVTVLLKYSIMSIKLFTYKLARYYQIETLSHVDL